MKEIVDSVPLRNQVVDIIHQMILNGELKSNEKISERKISSMMQISTTPVKEAFRILQVEGLISSSPRKGSFISSDVVEHLQQIVYLRSAIDGVAANFASRYATDGEIQEMQAILDYVEPLIASQENADLISKKNDEFHNILRSAAHNGYVVNLGENLRSIDNSIRSVINKVDYRNIKDRHEEHKAILEAVKSKNGDLAERLMIQHVREAPVVIDHKDLGSPKNGL